MERNSKKDCIVISSSESDSDLYDFSQKWKRKPAISPEHHACTMKKLRVSIHPLSIPYVPKNERSTRCAIVTPLPRAPIVNKEPLESSSCDDDIDKIVETLERQLQKKKQKRKLKRSKRRMFRQISDNSETVSSGDTSNQILDGYTRSVEKCKIGLRSEVKRVVPFQLPSYSLGKSQRNNGSGSGNDFAKSIDYLLPKEPNCADKKKHLFVSNGIISEVDTTDSDVEYQRKKCIKNDGESKSNEKRCSSLSQSVMETKRLNFEKVTNGSSQLEDVCLTCGTMQNVKAKHPLFNGSLCQKHLLMFQEWYFKYDEDGCQSYCAVCCMGNNVVLCDNLDCGRCYCSDCLHFLIGPEEYKKVAALKNWTCYFCSGTPNGSLLQTRENWRQNLRCLFAVNDETTKYSVPPIHPPIAPLDREPIRVLSLFDGIATGLVALKQLGLQIGKFVASEINEDAIRLVQNRHSEVIHIGDITKLTDDDVRRLGPFDLVMGGSPCNDLSGANPRRRGLVDPEGSGCLFFDFHRILRAVQPQPPPAGCKCDVTKESTRPFFWLFENVMSMKLIERHRISRFLQCDPITANARYVSAAARPRLFWGNIPGMRQLRLDPSPGDRLTVQDCLEPGRVAVVDKLNTITTNPSCLYAGNNRQPAVKHAGKDDTLWSTEVERIFGVPEHYTDVNNLGPKERLALLGRSWSVPVIRQILAPLKEYFKRK